MQGDIGDYGFAWKGERGLPGPVGLVGAPGEIGDKGYPGIQGPMSQG